MKKNIYTSPELIAENLLQADVITASSGVSEASEVDNAYFSISNLFG